MKRCPQCRRDYYDDTLVYCLDDGSSLLEGPASASERATAILHDAEPPSEAATRPQIHTTDQTAILPDGAEAKPEKSLSDSSERPPSAERVEQGKIGSRQRLLAGIGIFIFLVIGGFFGYRYFAGANSKQIDSIVVMPFANDSGNADVEYLSDGMTETLIDSLRQLPNLTVKARSSVFRYKGKDTDARTVGKDLNVQAILNGRFVLHGQDLILYVELVDVSTENSLWKHTYNKTMTNLVSLQGEIARDVAENLKLKLSGADQRRLAKNYTENNEAYQLYLKGRFHVFKLTAQEIRIGIDYFQQAIEIDPSYALAYVGLGEANRSLALAGEQSPTEYLPRSKAAAAKAVELDDTLAECHTALGVTNFWLDWDWSAAEAQYKRALELDPNNSGAHIFYAHLLSNTGRHAEAIVEARRARELDPLSPFVGSLEGQFLLHAGQTDEALDRLQKTFDLDPAFYFPHMIAASAYIEKGSYGEAISESRRANDLSPNQTNSETFEAYALAKSGKRDEARKILEALLKLSETRFVPPYHIAFIYQGLGETDKTFEWLEKAYQQRDPKMAFLLVEPKWKNLHNDPRFIDLLKRMGFPKQIT